MSVIVPVVVLSMDNPSIVRGPSTGVAQVYPPATVIEAVEHMIAAASAEVGCHLSFITVDPPPVRDVTFTYSRHPSLFPGLNGATSVRIVAFEKSVAVLAEATFDMVPILMTVTGSAANMSTAKVVTTKTLARRIFVTLCPDRLNYRVEHVGHSIELFHWSTQVTPLDVVFLYYACVLKIRCIAFPRS